MLSLLSLVPMSQLNTCTDVKDLYTSSRCCDDPLDRLTRTYEEVEPFPEVTDSYIEDMLFRGNEFVIVNEMFTKSPITPTFARSLSLFDKHVVDIVKMDGFWNEMRLFPRSGYSYQVGDMSYKRVFGLRNWEEFMSWFKRRGELNQLVDLSLGGNGLGLILAGTLMEYDTPRNTFKVYSKNATQVEEWFKDKDRFPEFAELSPKTRTTLVNQLKFQNPSLTDEAAVATLTTQYASFNLESYTASFGSVPSPIEYLQPSFPATAIVEYHLGVSPSYTVTYFNKLSFRMQSAMFPSVTHHLTDASHTTRLHVSELTASAFKAVALELNMGSITFTGLNMPIGENGAYVFDGTRPPCVVYTTDTAAATAAMSSPDSFPTRAEFAERDPVYGTLFPNTYVSILQNALGLNAEQAGLAFDQFSFKLFTETFNLQGQQIQFADPSTRWAA